MTIEELIVHWRIRRQVWFCLCYRATKPVQNPEGAQASLAEYDNVLNDLQDAGLVEPHWQSHPPTSTTDNGGFSQAYLAEYLAPADLPPVPMPTGPVVEVPK